MGSGALLPPVNNRSRSQGDKSVGGAEWWRVPHLMPCAVAAVIGIAISLSCWFAASVREDRLAELELTARTNSHAMVLQGEIGDYLDKLVALRAFFEASEAVSRPEFTTFSQSILQGHPAILAFSWIPRVTERSARPTSARPPPRALPAIASSRRSAAAA